MALLGLTWRHCGASATTAPRYRRPRRSLRPVGTDETHDLRYDRVDGDPNLDVLVGTMDDTAEWETVPGGSVALIDTDWSTLTIDVGDTDLAARVRASMHAERGRPASVGGRLPELLRAAGLDVQAETQATHTWDRWDPDESPAPHGCFSI